MTLDECLAAVEGDLAVKLAADKLADVAAMLAHFRDTVVGRADMQMEGWLDIVQGIPSPVSEPNIRIVTDIAYAALQLAYLSGLNHQACEYYEQWRQS